MKTLSTLLILIFLLPATVWAQTFSGDEKEDKRSLRKLSDTEYIRIALDYSLNYYRINNFKDASDFSDLAIKRAQRKFGKESAISVYLDLTERLISCCRNDARLLTIGLESIDLAWQTDNNTLAKSRMITLIKEVNASTKDPGVLSKAYSLTKTIANDEELITELKENNLSSIEANKMEAEIASKRQQLSSLNLESARQQVIIEYNNRLVDSMRYKGIVDSIHTISMTHQLNQKNAVIELEEAKGRQKNMILAAVAMGLLLLGAFVVRIKRFNTVLNKQKKELAIEQEKSESLLTNILPNHIAEELKKEGKVSPKLHDKVTIMFMDLVDFSGISKALNTQDLVSDLNYYFGKLDDLAEEFKLEKIKTIGDAYMCIGDLSLPAKESAINVIKFGGAVQRFLDGWNVERKLAHKPLFKARMGAHTGEVVAGVVGNKKFSYDVWGDSVNVAARMESKGESGKINISQSTYKMVNEQFDCKDRGKEEVKNMGKMNMYFVEI